MRHSRLIWSQPYNVRAETEAGAGGEPNRHGTTPSRNRILAYRLRRRFDLLARSLDKSRSRFDLNEASGLYKCLWKGTRI